MITPEINVARKEIPNYTMSIIDQEAFDKYWTRKRPNTKKAFLFAINNQFTFTQTARIFKVNPFTLTNHSQKLQKENIIKKTYTQRYKAKLEKTDIRKNIRPLLKNASIETLEKIYLLLVKEEGT